MQRFFRLLLVLVVINIGVLGVDAQNWIPDENLRNGVREALDLADGDPLTKTAMGDLTKLFVAKSGISDLTGLEHATNLTVLSIWRNNITDLSPIAGLTNLENLLVGNNPGLDISDLSDLTNLKRLSLASSDLSDISVLSNLENLEWLRLDNNDISDVNPLRNLENLTELRLARNPIVNTNPLANVVSNLTEPLDIVVIPNRNLEKLVRSTLINQDDLAEDQVITPGIMTRLTTLSGPQDVFSSNAPIIRELDGLEYATNLEELLLLTFRTRVSLEPLEGLQHLTHLKLNGRTTDLDKLSTLPSLTHLTIWKAGIRDATPIGALTDLEELDLSFNRLKDLSPLSNLENLTLLWLGYNTSAPFNANVSNALSDISPLADLAALENLDLKGNAISDISALENLTNLERAQLQLNEISDISALENLTNLERLYLQTNEISDISALRDLTNLEFLSLSSNEISDVSPLVGLTNLEKLTLKNNSITNAVLLYPLTQLNPPVDIDITVPVPVVVEVTDDNLASELREVLGLASDADIIDTHMVQLTSLDLYDVNIEDLTGLEYATNLTTLNVEDNSITDLSPLSDLARLTHLNLWNNDISDVSSLASLTQLEFLSFTDNSVSDVSALSGLVNLTKLYLKDNSVSDVSPLVNLTSLQELYLDGNPITNAGLLYPLTQQTPAVRIDIDVTPITVDITTPAGLISGSFDITITFSEAVSDFIQDDVSISGSDVTGSITSWSTEDNITYTATISPVVDDGVLSAVIVMSIPPDVVTNSGGVPNLASLSRSLRVVGGATVSVPDTNLAAAIQSALNLAEGQEITTGVLKRFTILNISYQQVSDLTGLEEATNLTWLTLALNEISDISPLLGLTKLRTLRLGDNSITDISGISSLTELGILDLVGNEITDISGLSGLSKLQILDLRENKITDVSPLVDMTHLSTLYLAGNSITNVGLLYPLTQQDSPVDIDIDVPFTGPTVTDFAWPSYLVDPYLTLYPNDSILGLTIDQDPFEVTITFSEEVTGFTDTDLIELEGDATAIVTSLTGSGSVYTAKIKVTHEGNGSGDGLLAIKIPEKVAESEGIGNAAYSTADQKTVRVVFYPKLDITAPTGEQSGEFNVTFSFSEPVTGFALDDIQGITSDFSTTFSGSDAAYTVTFKPKNSAYGSTLNLRVPAQAVTNAEGVVNTQTSTAQVEMAPYAPWDVDEDGDVDSDDAALVTAALGQSGADIVNSRTDVDGDGDVDADDLLLVTDNLDDAGNAAPAALRRMVNLMDAATLESLDRDVLQAQLQILRAESDGSLKYQNAIALLEAFLAAIRPDETVLLANYPNPFNPETWIPYQLANAAAVRITIYDTRGVVVRRLDLGHQREGYYTSRSRAAYWDGRNNVGERVASGIYFYQLEADAVSLLRKMVILK